MKKRLLVIDDEESICSAFQAFFEPRGWKVETCASGRNGIQRFQDFDPTLVFLDVRLPDIDGLEVLRRLRELDAEAKVIVISAYGSLETITQAVKGQAFDYLAKPIDLDEAVAVADRVLAGLATASETDAGESSFIVGSSKVMQEVYKRIGLVAQSDSSVLILGETGAGKELVARAIFAHSLRRDKPFVAVNCGALPENLVESELFGFEAGAFTGATTARPGKFEAADGGTLFLDEIGELPPIVQTKLLRVLDSQVIERLGSVNPIHLNVRILAATNKDLAAEVEAGRFRADLFYRLNVIHINVPPLRERKEDILPLARHFLNMQHQGTTLSDDAIEMLAAHDWPGNVRELKNAIEHAAVVSAGGPILPDHLPKPVTIRARSGDSVDGVVDSLLDQFEGEPVIYDKVVNLVERRMIERALAATNGNQSEAANLLGVHRNTLRNKIRDLGIDRQ